MTQPASSPPTSIKALINVIEHLPPDIYGIGRARFLRRLVHVVLAKHANPDGTSIYASLDRIAYLSLTTEKSVREVIKYLESVKLVRKLDEGHPIYGTNQYELLLPSPEILAHVTEQKTAALNNSREKTRRRVSSWRAKQAEDRKSDNSVTEAPSVTNTAFVTEDRAFCNGSSEVGNGSSEVGNGSSEVGNGSSGRSVTEAATSVDRPVPSLINRPLKPSNLPSEENEQSAGGMAGRVSPFSDGLAGNVDEWLSDCLELKSGQRVFPTREQKKAIHANAAPGHVVLSFYKFLLRPMGTAGLNDPFGMFVRELETRIEDVERDLADTSTTELLSDYHEEVFPYKSSDVVRLLVWATNFLPNTLKHPPTTQDKSRSVQENVNA